MSIFKKRKRADEEVALEIEAVAGNRITDNMSIGTPQPSEPMPTRPLWFRLYQSKKPTQVPPYSPVLMVRAGDVAAIHPNAFDPTKADILVGGHWFPTVHPFDEAVRSVYGVYLADMPDAEADWQRLMNDKKKNPTTNKSTRQ